MNKIKISLSFDLEEQALAVLEMLGYSKNESQRILSKKSTEINEKIYEKLSDQEHEIKNILGEKTHEKIKNLIISNLNDAVTEVTKQR